MKTTSNANARGIPRVVLMMLLAIPVGSAYAEPSWEFDQPIGIATCLQSGSGDQYMKVCWGADGNITHFESPAGFQHMDKTREGYTLCYGNPLLATSAWDVGNADSGWGNSSYSAADKTVVARTTTDGQLRLKQTFSRDPKKRDITIKMEIKNVSGRPVYIGGLSRYFSGDGVNNGQNAQYGNIYFRTNDSVGAVSLDAYALSLTAVSDPAVPDVRPSPAFEKCTQPGSYPSGASGFLVGRVYIPMRITLAPNATTVTTFVYRRL